MKKLMKRCLCLALALVLTAGTGLSARAADAFEEVTAVDNEECAVTVKSIDPDDMWGYTLKVLLENRSGEKTYMYTVDAAFINGVECDPFFAAEVASGKKANEDINFDLDALEENGVGEPTDIGLVFQVYDADDWMADPVAYETVHVYPQGEDTAEAFVRQAQDTDVVLVDNDDVSAVVIGYETDGIFGYEMKMFLVNKTDKELMFTMEDASVNGFMIDPYYAHTLMPGMCCFDEAIWSASDLEDNDIGTVEELEFTLRAYDAEDWMADDVLSETVTVTP